MLGPGMVCSVGIPAACMTPVSALLSPVSRDCGGGVTGPQRRQQQQTTAPAAMFCCCGCCGGGDQRLGRWPASLLLIASLSRCSSCSTNIE